MFHASNFFPRTVVSAAIHALEDSLADVSSQVPLHLKDLGHEVTHGAFTRGSGWMKHVILKYKFVQDVVEKKQTTLVYVNTNSEQGRPDDNVSYN